MFAKMSITAKTVHVIVDLSTLANFNVVSIICNPPTFLKMAVGLCFPIELLSFKDVLQSLIGLLQFGILPGRPS